MKSNGELFTVQYPNEWAKATPNEIEHFLNELAAQGSQNLANSCKTCKDEQKPAWSKEDEKKRTLLISILEVNHPNDYFKANPANTSNMEAMHTEELVSWLKSLRPQNWTKEDKERYISCLQRLSTGNPEQPETINSKWFKEHVYPQSTWKPSDEQMKALDDVISSRDIKYDVLSELLKDLKKIKG